MNRVDEICTNIITQKELETVYIYPFGTIGFEVRQMLEEKYGAKQKLVCIDNKLSEWNSNVYSLDILHSVRWESEKAIVVLASESDTLYYELREELKGIVPEQYILDYCSVHPFCFHGDPRIAALAIAAGEIYANKVEGAVAEAGVYRGDFAQFINMLFPKRSFYLLDSFEGFSSKSFDLSQDSLEQVKGWEGYKSDTSESIVLRKLPYPDNAVIRRGYVPETLEGIQDTFAFVNLDMDLFMPTYEALCFFWSNMSPGGYIFVHDINNWDGCGKAVRTFCKEYNTGYVCLNDRITAAIAKPYGGN